MAQRRRGRKGWPTVLRVAGLIALSAVASAPLTFVVAMLLTPLLWRLESVVGIELAGHSGPSDWILGTMFGLFTIGLFVALRVATGLRPREASEEVPPPNVGDPT